MFYLLLSAATLLASPSRTVAAPPGIATDSVPAKLDTAQVRLTEGEISKMKAFLGAVMSEWNKPEAQQFTRPVAYPIVVGNVGGAEAQFANATINLPDMGSYAAGMPGVASGLKSAGLSAAEYMQIHHTLVDAHITEQLDRLANGATLKFTDTVSILGKNVAFLRANPQAIPSLVAVGLEMPNLQSNAQQPPPPQLPYTEAAKGRAPAQTPLALTHVTVIDVTNGNKLKDQTVVVTGNRITQIAADGKATLPKDAKVVDARGKYVVPGFWEMHIHLDAAAPQIYPLLIAHGITGVRDMVQRFPGGSDSLVSWQRQVRDGTLIGPRVPGPSADLTYNMVMKTPADAKRVMDSLQAIHAVFVKFHDDNMADRNLYFSIMREARSHGLSIVGHVPHAITNVEASDSGQLTIEHIEENHQCWPTWPRLLGDSAAADARCKPMVDAYLKNGTYMMVGLNGHWLDDQYRPDRQIGLWSDERHFLRMLHRLGMRRFITGTDWAPIFMGWDKRFLPGLSSVEDMVTMTIDADIPPLEALQAATLHPAEVFKMADSVGTVSVGKYADLVILNDDPLADIRTVLQPFAVVANGRYFDRALLTALDPDGTKPTAGLLPARGEGYTPPAASK